MNRSTKLLTHRQLLVHFEDTDKQTNERTNERMKELANAVLRKETRRRGNVGATTLSRESLTLLSCKKTITLLQQQRACTET